MVTHPIWSIASENEPVVSCSRSLDLVLEIDSVTPTMGALEASLSPIDPSECSLQDVVLPSDEDILEVMNGLDTPLDDVAMVLSNDQIFGLDCPTIEPNPNFPSKYELIDGRSSEPVSSIVDPISLIPSVVFP